MRAWPILLFLVVGLAVGIWFVGQPPGPGFDPTLANSMPDPVEAAPEDPESIRSPLERPAQESEPEHPPLPVVPVTEPAKKPAAAVLMLAVLDQSARTPVPGFRATIEIRSPGFPHRTTYLTEPPSNPVPLDAEPGQTLVVRVEAPGYAPAPPLEVTFDGSTSRIEKTVFLAVAMRFTGVEFTVQDTASAPIPHLEVATEIERGGSFAPLWTRRKSDPKGRYLLPNLAPGRYRMHLRAVDEKGRITLHLRHTFRCELTGNEHIREPVTLQTGANLELRLADGDGRRIGKEVRIALTHPDGKVHESVWQPLVEGQPDPKGRLTADHLATDAPARLWNCLPAGAYSLELQWAEGPPVVRAVDLTGGRITPVEVTLTRNR